MCVFVLCFVFGLAPTRLSRWTTGQHYTKASIDNNNNKNTPPPKYTTTANNS
jgi:hypothetical protein